VQVVRCCLEHAASVAKTFLTSDVVVVDIKELEPDISTSPMDGGEAASPHAAPPSTGVASELHLCAHELCSCFERARMTVCCLLDALGITMRMSSVVLLRCCCLSVQAGYGGF